MSYMHWLPASLGQILGFFFAPVAWLIGVPWHDCPAIGDLLGTRMALNEVIAYIHLGAQKAALAPRSFIIATFALCGFANLGSIGMQIGGIGALVPERRNELAQLGVRAMLAGTMANLISAAIAGMFLGYVFNFESQMAVVPRTSFTTSQRRPDRRAQRLSAFGSSHSSRWG